MEIFLVRKEGDKPILHEKLQYVMACYSFHLASGATLQANTIKSGTIKEYLLAAATLIRRFDILGRDSRKELNCDKLCDPINKVLAQVKRFEEMPNRCEAYTPAMHKQFEKMIVGLNKNGFESSTFDWCTVGLQNGCRRSEWCQEKYKTMVSKFEKNPRGDARAFTLVDIEFFGIGRKRMTREFALKHPDRVMHVKVRYRWQKNNDHGQKKWQSRNITKPHLCSVSAWLRIVQRYIRLKGDKIDDEPLSIYRTKKGHNNNIVASNVAELMRELVKTTYNETDVKELSKYSCHSLRVGACCCLYAAGIDEPNIKKLLRWRSDSWMDYIRDMIVTTHKHNKALNSVDDMPLM